MDERLWTAKLSLSQLLPWLEPPRRETPYTILEQLTRIDFPAPNEVIDVEAWERGRIFGEQFELRWERDGNTYSVWLTGVLPTPYLDENRHLETADELHDLSYTTMKTNGCFLWGRDEVRVAHAPKYRALSEGKGRPQLNRLDFRSANGKLVYSRYTGMQWEEAS